MKQTSGVRFTEYSQTYINQDEETATEFLIEGYVDYYIEDDYVHIEDIYMDIRRFDGVYVSRNEFNSKELLEWEQRIASKCLDIIRD